MPGTFSATTSSGCTSLTPSKNAGHSSLGSSGPFIDPATLAESHGGPPKIAVTWPRNRRSLPCLMKTLISPAYSGSGPSRDAGNGASSR